MNYSAIIIENRFDASKIVEEHKRFLGDKWRVQQIFDPSVNSIESYNRLLTNGAFWINFGCYDRVLIFQHDSALLRTGVEEFIEYDYVGAPWKFQQHGGNGGLSLRNPTAMYACIKKQPWNPKLGNEDVYFSNLLKDMPEYKLAPRDVCSKFSCESIFQLGTLGYHAIDKYLTEEEVSQIKTQYVR